VSARVRWWVVFLAGGTAFTITTALFVTIGTVLAAVIPVTLVRIAGGVVMVAYGLWEARSLVGLGAVKEEEARVGQSGGSLKAFFALVGALALLDIAGDATEILTVVFVSQYSDPLLVFAGCMAGLLTATALEASLGSRLGRLLTPRRLQYGSAVVFVAIGVSILALVFY
jgi:putative Ca2+/H+ antiporter (TMEM165/GDT1 family)